MAIEYTPEQRAADAEIATAMGLSPESWQSVCIVDAHATDEDVWCYTCCDVIDDQPKVQPRFHESHEARATLLEWLAADDGRWLDFEKHLVCDNSMPKRGFEMARAMMLATPAQVAEATHRVIMETKK